jgi:hypothetical protein
MDGLRGFELPFTASVTLRAGEYMYTCPLHTKCEADGSWQDCRATSYDDALFGAWCKMVRCTEMVVHSCGFAALPNSTSRHARMGPRD